MQSEIGRLIGVIDGVLSRRDGRSHGLTIPVSDWILLGAGEDPKWSADGKAVYVRSQADGFTCVWRQPDEVTKRPNGPAEPWVHFHGLTSPGLLTPGLFRIAAARNRIASLLGEQEEVVWRRNSPGRF